MKHLKPFNEKKKNKNIPLEECNHLDNINNLLKELIVEIKKYNDLPEEWDIEDDNEVELWDKKIRTIANDCNENLKHVFWNIQDASIKGYINDIKTLIENKMPYFFK